MIKTIRFKQAYRTFKEGREIHLRDGINYIVGSNGSGKSSLIRAIYDKGLREKNLEVSQDHEGKRGLLKFDMELDNPRSQSLAQCMESGGGGMSAFTSFFNSRSKSHGEANGRILLKELSSWNDKSTSPCLVLLDEPEQAFSLDKILEVKEVLNRIAGKGHQLLVSTHHPLMIVGEIVFSIQHDIWMPGQDYFRLIVGEEAWQKFKTAVVETPEF